MDKMTPRRAARVADGKTGGNSAQRRRARRDTPLEELFVAEVVSHTDNMRQTIKAELAGPVLVGAGAGAGVRDALTYLLAQARRRRG